MGIVGGANLYFTPESMSPLAHLNFLSPDSRCYSFDRRANGYSRGDGYGVLVLKPLSRALEDRDPVRAVIRSTASNENGRTVGGITKVDFEAQRTLIETAYRDAGLDPAWTRYAEAHAPGTEGDIVETSAIASVFSKHRSKEDPLYMGSVKANVGHLEGASGIASLIKVVLMLERGLIPRLANFEQLHCRILGNEWNMAFPTGGVQWPAGTRQASINSFGFGGANAHVVLQDGREYEWPRAAMHAGIPSLPCPQLLVWSAADETGTRRFASAMQLYLARDRRLDTGKLRSIAYTLAQRRSRLPWKCALVVPTVQNQLNASLSEVCKPIRSLQAPPLVLVFTGQGATWARMGTQFLYNDIFRGSLDRFSRHLIELGASWNAIEELPNAEQTSQVHEPAYAQPLCTAIQIALVDMLQSHGVNATYCIGHSSAEIAAAYATGAISASSACKIAYFRGQLIAHNFQKEGKYGMLVLGLSNAGLTRYLAQLQAQVKSLAIFLACLNSPRNITLSGERAQLQLLRHTGGGFYIRQSTTSAGSVSFSDSGASHCPL